MTAIRNRRTHHQPVIPGGPIPILHFPLNEGAGNPSDIISGNDLPLNTNTVWVTGPTALDFDGGGSTGMVSDDDEFPNLRTLTDGLTVFCRVSAGSLWTNLQHSICSYARSGVTRKFELTCQTFSDTGNSTFFWRVVAGGTVDVAALTATLGIAIDEEFTYAGTYDGVDMRIYINNVLSVTEPHAVGGNIDIPAPADANFSLGGLTNFGATSGSVQSWDGTIRDFQIFNTALSEVDMAPL